MHLLLDITLRLLPPFWWLHTTSELHLQLERVLRNMRLRMRLNYLIATLAALMMPASAGFAVEGETAGWMEIMPYASWNGSLLVQPANGPAKVDLPQEGSGLICMGGGELAIRCEERFLHPGEPVELLDREPGTAVSGRVLVNGETASDVRVALVLAGVTARRPLRLPLSLEDGKLKRELVTDAAGRFSTPPLAADTYRLELVPIGGRVELTDPFVVPAPEPPSLEAPAKNPPPLPKLDLGDLDLTLGIAVEISVINESHEPVDGAIVSASQGKPPSQVVMFSTRSDAEGHAVLRGFQPNGPIQASCANPGYSRFETRYDTPPTWIECVLRPHARLTGEIFSEAEGIADVTVSLPDRGKWAETDETGSFQLTGLDAGKYRLVVAAPGFQTVERRGSLVAGKTLAEVIDLEPAPLRWGLVVDATTGEPVAGAHLVAIAPQGAVATTSNSAGELFFEAASNRSLLLEVKALGYPAHRVELEPTAGTEDEPWRVELGRGGRLNVTVWSSANGEPCVGCDLAILKDFAIGEPPPPAISLKTGVDGLVTSEELPVGRYRVHLEEVQSLGSAIQVRSGHNVKLADIRPGAVTDVVFGEPRQTLEVRFHPPPAPGWRLRCTGKLGDELYDLRADGSFEVQRQPDEALSLRLVNDGVSVSQGVLPASAPNPIQLDLPRTLVTGRLIDTEDLQTHFGLNVIPVTHSGSGAWVQPTADGRFEISFLPAGAYHLAVGDQRLGTFDLTVSESKDLGEVSAFEQP